MITLEDLKGKGACYWGGEPHKLADRVEANLPATLHEIMQLDWVPVNDREWVFGRFAIAPHWEAYEKAIAPHLETYAKAKAPHRETYNKAITATLKEMTK